MRNRRCAVPGSNASPSTSSFSRPKRYCRKGPAISKARLVGVSPRLVRTNSGSSKVARKRPSIRLAADCVRPSRSAARVTFRSSKITLSAINKFRSVCLIFRVVMKNSPIMHWTIWVVELMITSEKERRSFMEATTHQTVIVTGGATGIGYAIAEQFVRRGANVFLNGRTEAKLAAAADRLGGSGRASFLACDATAPANAESIVDAARDRFGRVDVLVNNAGIFYSKPVTDYDIGELEIGRASWRERA